MGKDFFKYNMERTEKYDMTISSVCDLDLSSIWHMITQRAFHHALANECDINPFTPNRILSDTVVRLCWSNCTRTVYDRVNEKFREMPNLEESRQREMPNLEESRQPCEGLPEGTIPDLVEEIVSDKANLQDCRDVPIDTFTAFIETGIQRRCWLWSPPSVLWSPNDGEPRKDVKYPKHEICVDVQAQQDGKHVDTFAPRKGTICQDGTTCRCHNQALFKHKEAQLLRNELELTVKDGAVNLHVAETVKKWAGMHVVGATKTLAQMSHIIPGPVMPAVFLSGAAVHSMYKKDWPKLGAILAGAVVGGALSAVHVPLLFSAAAVYFVQAGIMEYVPECNNDRIGCWPAPSTYDDKNNCLVDIDAAETNLNPAAFLPPPGLMMNRDENVHHVSLGMGGISASSSRARCTLSGCSAEGLLKQTVGWVDKYSKFNQLVLGKHFMNCQPLQWREMTQHQQQEFAAAVRKSFPGVEDLPTKRRVDRLVACAESDDGCGWRATRRTETDLQTRMEEIESMLRRMP